MLRIGLTGGIASGKSAVADMLAASERARVHVEARLQAHRADAHVGVVLPALSAVEEWEAVTSNMTDSERDDLFGVLGSALVARVGADEEIGIDRQAGLIDQLDDRLRRRRGRRGNDNATRP